MLTALRNATTTLLKYFQDIIHLPLFLSTLCLIKLFIFVASNAIYSVPVLFIFSLKIFTKYLALIYIHLNILCIAITEIRTLCLK
jgi:hypothetical protein